MNETELIAQLSSSFPGLTMLGVAWIHLSRQFMRIEKRLEELEEAVKYLTRPHP